MPVLESVMLALQSEIPPLVAVTVGLTGAALMLKKPELMVKAGEVDWIRMR